MSENVKQRMQSWLQITPANVHSFNIQETMDFQANVIKNRICLRIFWQRVSFAVIRRMVL